MARALYRAAAAFLLGICSASAADRSLKIGVINDQSSIYADMGGPGSVVAANLAVEDSGLRARGWNVEILTADHGNKADVASTITRQWFDTQGVDAVADVTNSAAALAVSQIVRDKNKVMLASGPAVSDLTGKACTPNTVHWTHDTWAFANGIGKAMVETGGKTWFFLTADFAFGYALERDTEKMVLASGGKVLGHVRAPNNTSDFSSYLLQAQASGAQVIGLANSGGDTVNSIKQAAEFGITGSKQRLAGLLIYITDVHAIGLQLAQGLSLVAPFYWDMTDGTRAFSSRFAALRSGAKPSMVQAGVYASILHYLKAVEALGEASDGAKVVAKMKAMPTDDPLFGKGYIRADGRKMHPMYLFTAKTPSESQYPWDYYTYKATIPAEVAFRPLADGGCPLIAKSQ
ncbi:MULTISPECIES: ABC transporter substrate-binding protein [unclassified Methylobacterium]|uniref:ABC transporter substrate-binding protein n=1 Tax=unclassified Methylobacterium TaxID=2615210 RepID=UPI0011C1F344|nr:MULTISPECIES: ABC transporter substrate-binding protein [unclassified Methylobacterium]MCJ2116298.1 ABC transporter substrate-binding protein [Methylobacterium sp. J-001]QEE41657.1 ABC transporter substrate-binding protein [Methylobacterium sp. WL1]TXN54972.1 ABC transporter substrate-binding protein [Methylobacterium sp. WL2]